MTRCCSGIFCAESQGDRPNARCERQAARAVINQVLQEVSDLAPWAYTYKERPADLLEVRAVDLYSIVRGAIESMFEASSGMSNWERKPPNESGSSPLGLTEIYEDDFYHV